MTETAPEKVTAKAWTDAGEMVVLRTRRPTDRLTSASAEVTLEDLRGFIAECERRDFPPESVVYMSGMLGDASMTCKRLTRVATE